jgi:hypothetical protein
VTKKSWSEEAPISSCHDALVTELDVRWAFSAGGVFIKSILRVFRRGSRFFYVKEEEVGGGKADTIFPFRTFEVESRSGDVMIQDSWSFSHQFTSHSHFRSSMRGTHRAPLDFDRVVLAGAWGFAKE